MKKTSYSIGQVSKLLDLSVEGIRNYEKAGIIQSSRKEESNYRSYRYLDITSLIRARMYRSLGFSLQEIEALTNEYETPEIVDALQARQIQLEREQTLLKAKLDFIEFLRTETETLDERLDRVEICRIDAYFRIEFAKDGEVDFSEQTVKLVRKWMEMTPFAHVSTRYNGEHVYGGLAIREKYGVLFGLDREDPLIRYLPPAICLRTVVREDDNGHSDASRLCHLLDFAEHHRFTLSEDMIGHTLAGIRKKTAYKRYRRVDAQITNL